MTDHDFLAWLARGGRRVALVEVDTDQPRHLSTAPYATLPTDAPPNRLYLPVVAQGFAFTERLSLEGRPSISVGDIELHNEDGALDGWLDEVWTNRAVRVYIGDAAWPRGDFRLVFSGVAAKLSSSHPGRLNIVLRNKLERLNTPVTEATLGGSTPNAERLRPLTLGECHNIEPLLADPAQHEYLVHDGALERIIEVRDNGVPVAFTPLLGQGRFRLQASPAGTITASVQGGAPYRNTVAQIIAHLAQHWGASGERLTAADIDAARLQAFDAAHPQPVGVWLPDRANVLQVCQQLAESVGAQVVMSRAGLLRLVPLDVPGLGQPVDIHPRDYEAHSLAIKERPDVVAGVKLGFCRNWVQQHNLDTGIPAGHKDLYGQEWLTATASDAATASAYRLHAQPQQADTLLLRRADAQAEAQRRLNLWKTPRTVFRVRGFAQLLLLELGQAVRLHGARFGLEGGRTGVVVGLQLDWIAGRADVEVLI